MPARDLQALRPSLCSALRFRLDCFDCLDGFIRLFHSTVSPPLTVLCTSLPSRRFHSTVVEASAANGSLATSQNVVGVPPYAALPLGHADRSPFGYEYCARERHDDGRLASGIPRARAVRSWEAVGRRWRAEMAERTSARRVDATCT